MTVSAETGFEYALQQIQHFFIIFHYEEHRFSTVCIRYNGKDFFNGHFCQVERLVDISAVIRGQAGMRNVFG